MTEMHLYAYTAMFSAVRPVNAEVVKEKKYWKLLRGGAKAPIWLTFELPYLGHSFNEQ